MAPCSSCSAIRGASRSSSASARIPSPCREPRPAATSTPYPMSSLPRPRSLVALIALVAAALALVARAAEPARTISLVTDPAPGPAAQHGLAQLAGALRARGWTVDLASTPAAAKSPRHILARSQPPTCRPCSSMIWRA